MGKVIFAITGLLFVIAFSLTLVSCDEDSDPVTPATHYADENWSSANLVRGATLYDKWWTINGGAEPTTDFNPIWGTQSSNTRTDKDTWRCKECHGWDYKGKDGAYASGSHFTGFAGVFQARSDNKTDIFDGIKDAAGDHDLSGVLTDADILDLTKFIVDGLVDMSEFINYETKASSGDAVAGQALYEANCLACHGVDGATLNFKDDENPEYLGDIANGNPWETLHKLRWGHPGSQMPSMVAAELTATQQSDLLAYTQTLEPEPAHYAEEHWDEADLVAGGAMYDKWWAINGGAEPTEDFAPLWATQNSNTRSGKDTWRCKECHGWDYKGVAGAYSGGSHMTGFAGVWDARTNDKTAIFDAIKDAGGDHDLSGVLSDGDVLNLTKVVVDGLIDMSLYIDYDAKASLGTAANGQANYDANCAGCHGVDGKTLNFGSEEDPEYLGDLALDNPWETLHKLRWGQPGSAMPSMVDVGLTIEEQSDLLAYAQSLGE